jgi:hypothetical protein
MRLARSRQSARLRGGVIASARRLAGSASRPAEADPVDADPVDADPVDADPVDADLVDAAFRDGVLPAPLVSRAIFAPAAEIAADPAAR